MKVLFAGLTILLFTSAYASDYSYEEKTVSEEKGVISVTYKNPTYKGLKISAYDYQQDNLKQREYNNKDLCSLMGEDYDYLQHAAVNKSRDSIKSKTKYVKITTRPKISIFLKFDTVESDLSDEVENQIAYTRTYTVFKPYEVPRIEIKTRGRDDTYRDRKSIEFLRCHSRAN